MTFADFSALIKASLFKSFNVPPYYADTAKEEKCLLYITKSRQLKQRESRDVTNVTLAKQACIYTMPHMGKAT